MSLRHVLSIRQPWLWAIFHAGKRIENRPWSTAFRGELFLHAAKAFASPSSIEECRRLALAEGISMPPLGSMPRGMILGRCNVIACLPVEKISSPWADESGFGFVLADVQEIPPVQHRGGLGIQVLRGSSPRTYLAIGGIY